MQYNAMQCNAMQCNAMQCNAMQCNAMQCIAMQCNATQCNAMHCNVMQCKCNATQCRYHWNEGWPYGGYGYFLSAGLMRDLGRDHWRGCVEVVSGASCRPPGRPNHPPRAWWSPPRSSRRRVVKKQISGRAERAVCTRSARAVVWRRAVVSRGAVGRRPRRSRTPRVSVGRFTVVSVGPHSLARSVGRLLARRLLARAGGVVAFVVIAAW